MKKLFAKIVDVKPNEVRALWLAFVFFFVVLAGYYVIRPVRDNIGASFSENLWWMFTVVLVTMIVANALFSAIVARMSRRRFIPIAYRFFAANLIIFYILMRTLAPAQQTWVNYSFFVWVSVFNLFVVTVFWAFMTDLFNNEQGKRLFGFISIGGALGGMVGPVVTVSLVQKIGAANLILVSAAMLEIAAQSVRFFPADFARQDRHDVSAEKAIGGSVWSGITHIFRSPYLFGLFVFILLYTITSTWAYFQQSDLTRFQIHDRAVRTAFLASLDLSVNSLTLLGQIFLTGRLLKWLGVGATLVLMPALSMIGFITIGFVPLLSFLAFFQILRRAATFALT